MFDVEEAMAILRRVREMVPHATIRATGCTLANGQPALFLHAEVIEGGATERTSHGMAGVMGRDIEKTAHSYAYVLRSGLENARARRARITDWSQPR